jgi:hypothetical protein
MINPKFYPLGAVGGAFLLAIAVGGAAPAPVPAAPAASAPAVGTELGERTVEDGGTGPYKAIQVGDSSLPTHTIFRPKDLSAFGDKKLPILAWGNGGCANSSSGHQNYLSEIASHGFLVVAIGPMQTGGGRGGAGGGGTKSSQLLDAVDWAIAQNKNQTSRYFNKIDVSKIGVFGHSCGGLQALEVSPDPRITTTIVVDSGVLNSGGGAPGGGGRGAGRGPAPATAPAAGGAIGPALDQEQLVFVGMPGGAGGAGGRMGGRAGAGGGMPGGAARGGGGGMMAGMPALTKEDLTKLHGPVFYLLGGESDIAYANGMDDFKRIEKLPVFLANKDVGHGGTFTQPHGGDWAMASVAWFKWQLKGDADAGSLFTGNPCGLSQKTGWKVDKKNIP